MESTEYNFNEFKKLSEENKRLTSQVADQDEQLISKHNIIKALTKEMKEYHDLLKEMLEYEGLTVGPRPPHPYYTYVSRVKSLLEKFNDSKTI